MNLKKIIAPLALLASIGCVEYEITRKPYKKAEVKKPVFEETAPVIREGYFPLRLEQGEFEIYDLTFYKPKENPTPIHQLEYLKKTFGEHYFQIKDSNKGINPRFLESGTRIISTPNHDAIRAIEKSISKENTNNATIDRCRAICNVHARNFGFGSSGGYGNFIGGNYILVPASTIYGVLIEQELGKKTELTFSNTIEQKLVGSAIVNKARILAINPLKDLALLEKESKSDSGLFIPIVQENEIEEVKFYTPHNLRNLENYFRLSLEQMIWRTEEKELDLSKSLGYGLASANIRNLKGCGVYNDKGLIGIIANNFYDYPAYEDSETQNSLVIPSSHIREFLTDYLNFLKSGSKNLETMLIDAPTTPSEINPTTFTPTPFTPSTVSTSLPEITQQDTETTPNLETPLQQEPANFPWGKLILGYFSLVLGAGIIGRIFYKPKEEIKQTKPANIEERLTSIENWLASKEVKKEKPKVMEIPKTKIDTRAQETVDILESADILAAKTHILPPKKEIDYAQEFMISKIAMPEPMFVNWLIEKVEPPDRAERIAKICNLENMYYRYLVNIEKEKKKELKTKI